MQKRTTQRAKSLALRLLILSAVVLLWAGAACAAQAARLKVAVTSPWLYEVASFICGSQAKVRSISRLNARGLSVLTARPQAGEMVIAFDPSDAVRHKINTKNKNLKILFDKIQLSEDELRCAFFDPAMLPFIAQEIMKAISSVDQKNYSYYQRRLAEFQSRIDSTIDVGRHLIGSANLLDLTGAEGTWVRSAITGAVRPPESVWLDWLSAGGGTALTAALDEASRRGWLLLLDPWTPEFIRSAASAYHNSLMLPAPPEGTEFFVFLHEIFNIIAAKSTPDTLGVK